MNTYCNGLCVWVFLTSLNSTSAVGSCFAHKQARWAFPSCSKEKHSIAAVARSEVTHREMPTHYNNLAWSDSSQTNAALTVGPCKTLRICRHFGSLQQHTMLVSRCFFTALNRKLASMPRPHHGGNSNHIITFSEHTTPLHMKSPGCVQGGSMSASRHRPFFLVHVNPATV